MFYFLLCASPHLGLFAIILSSAFSQAILPEKFHTINGGNQKSVASSYSTNSRSKRVKSNYRVVLQLHKLQRMVWIMRWSPLYALSGLNNVEIFQVVLDTNLDASNHFGDILFEIMERNTNIGEFEYHKMLKSKLINCGLRRKVWKKMCRRWRMSLVNCVWRCWGALGMRRTTPWLWCILGFYMLYCYVIWSSYLSLGVVLEVMQM